MCATARDGCIELYEQAEPRNVRFHYFLRQDRGNDLARNHQITICLQEASFRGERHFYSERNANKAA